MKHVFIILIVIAIIVTGIFLPFIHGDYDYFAVGLSFIFQFAAFTSLLFVPVGLIWAITAFVNKKNSQPKKYLIRLRKIAFVISIIIILAASIGSFASHNRFFAIIILGIGVYIIFLIVKKNRQAKAQNLTNLHIIPYYFILIPLTVVCIRLTYFEKEKDKSTDFVIKQSEQLITDIEAYKRTNGHYPTSLHSTIEDYHTGVSGIPRFHYELRGGAYNLYFVQTSNMLGTEEIIMYNKLDEQEMTVHNQDLLRIPYNSIIHGYHNVQQLPQEHWKIFYFD